MDAPRPDAGHADGAPPDAARPDARGGADVLPANAGATARLAPLVAGAPTGIAAFVQAGGKVTMTVELSGAPMGDRGLHIHEVGDCSGNGAATGADWNPTGGRHNLVLGGGNVHYGDAGNVKADASGHVVYELATSKWTIGGGGPSDVLGKALVVHVKRDDEVTQPDGDTAGVASCGVIAR
jgi:Cu-Zn family superoxide dismutase